MEPETSNQKKSSKLELTVGSGAILFTEENGVEIIIPKLDNEEPLPKHLWPLFAIAGKLHDKKFLEEAWEQFQQQAQALAETRNSSGSNGIDLNP